MGGVGGPNVSKILTLTERGGLCPLPGFFGGFVHNALRAPKVIIKGLGLGVHPDPEPLVNVQGWETGAADFLR